MAHFIQFKTLLFVFLFALTFQNSLGFLEFEVTTTSSQKPTDPYSYNMYHFSLQWEPEVCKEFHSQVCKDEDDLILSIHGLWPNAITQHHEDENCNDGETIPINDNGSPTFLKMRQTWRSLKDGGNDPFWTHEYNKHGYCYSTYIKDFEPMKYFEKGLELYDKYDLANLVKKITDKIGKTIVKFTDFESSLKSYFNSFGIQCKHNEGKQYLEGVFMLFDLHFSEWKEEIKHLNCNSAMDLDIPFK